jgi:hypothetical protein
MRATDALDKAGLRSPDAIFVKQGGVSVSYQDAVSMSHRIAVKIQSLGIATGTRVAFLSPTDILKILKERVPGLPARDFVVFCSTIVALDKELGFGQRWQFELEDPVLGRMISHTYQVEQLLDEIAEPYRVPVVTGKL